MRRARRSLSVPERTLRRSRRGLDVHVHPHAAGKVRSTGHRVCQKAEQPVSPRLQIEMHDGWTTRIDAGHPTGFPTCGIRKPAGPIPFNEVLRRCALSETNHHHFVSLPAVIHKLHGSSPRLERATQRKCKIGQTKRRIGARRWAAGRRSLHHPKRADHAAHGVGPTRDVRNAAEQQIVSRLNLNLDGRLIAGSDTIHSPMTPKPIRQAWRPGRQYPFDIGEGLARRQGEELDLMHIPAAIDESHPVAAGFELLRAGEGIVFRNKRGDGCLD